MKVAAAHVAPVFMNAMSTADKAVAYIERAKDDQVDLLVFPETFIPGFPVNALLLLYVARCSTSLYCVALCGGCGDSCDVVLITDLYQLLPSASSSWAAQNLSRPIRRNRGRGDVKSAVCCSAMRVFGSTLAALQFCSQPRLFIWSQTCSVPGPKHRLFNVQLQQHSSTTSCMLSRLAVQVPKIGCQSLHSLFPGSA